MITPSVHRYAGLGPDRDKHRSVLSLAVRLIISPNISPRSVHETGFTATDETLAKCQESATPTPALPPPWGREG